MQKPLLFSIHGINTTGAWQEGCSAVLSPFYEYKPIKYTEFKEWAVPKLAMDMIALLLSGIMAFCLWKWKLTSGMVFWNVYILATCLVVLALNVVADRLRGKVIDKVYEEISRISADESPHLIAHSLGTFLTARALTTYQGLQCKIMILNGCVLDRSFPWSRIRLRFEHIINEVGWQDPVPYAATVLSCVVLDMGCAGVLGFKGKGTVHDVTPEQEYPNCRTSKCPCSLHASIDPCNAIIHNVHHEKLRHSDYFKGLYHAWYFWLPSLWGYDPMLYRKFREACQRCYRNEIEGCLPTEQDEAVNKLKQSCWGWTRGSLEEFTKQQIIRRAEQKTKKATSGGTSVAKPPDSAQLEQATDLVISTLWEKVSLAAKESIKPAHRDEDLLQYLEPRRALKKALDAAAKKIPWLD